MRIPPEVRFWAKVQKGPECWTWTGAIDKGYGAFGFAHGDTRKAHRVAWELTNAPIPAGLLVCHHCDNPPCVRPSHLFLGTTADNLNDMRAKGRGSIGDVHWSRARPERVRRGSSNGAARLTEPAVRSIKDRLALGESQQSIATDLGVGRTTIRHIAYGDSWRHVV